MSDLFEMRQIFFSGGGAPRSKLLQELQARNPHENHGALEQGLRDKWRAGITEAQIVDDRHAAARLLKNVGHLFVRWMIVNSVLAPAGGRRPAGAAW